MRDDQSKEQQEVEAPAEDGLRTVVTPLMPVVQQLGNHVMGALQQPDTVAVLTTITGSRNGQQVVSIPLSPQQMNQVNLFLSQVEESEEPELIDCVGFHCVLTQE